MPTFEFDITGYNYSGLPFPGWTPFLHYPNYSISGWTVVVVPGRDAICNRVSDGGLVTPQSTPLSEDYTASSGVGVNERSPDPSDITIDSNVADWDGTDYTFHIVGTLTYPDNDPEWQGIEIHIGVVRDAHDSAAWTYFSAPLITRYLPLATANRTDRHYTIPIDATTFYTPDPVDGSEVPTSFDAIIRSEGGSETSLAPTDPVEFDVVGSTGVVWAYRVTNVAGESSCWIFDYFPPVAHIAVVMSDSPFFKIADDGSFSPNSAIVLWTPDLGAGQQYEFDLTTFADTLDEPYENYPLCAQVKDVAPFVANYDTDCPVVTVEPLSSSSMIGTSPDSLGGYLSAVRV